jgi:hypothetical protein
MDSIAVEVSLVCSIDWEFEKITLSDSTVLCDVDGNIILLKES